MNASSTVAHSEFQELALVEACTYCGMPAGSIDHIPPRYMRQHLRDVELSAREFTVPSCRECNSSLTDRPLLTITERRAFIKQWLRKRYARVLKMPNWTQDELAELSPQLRRKVEGGISHRNALRARLAWPFARHDESRED